MDEHSNFSGCAIVVAHPDDEVLWASSILAGAGRVVLCFCDVPSKPELSAARRRALVIHPLPAIQSLDIQEAGIFNAAAWPLPAETEYGLAMRDRLRARQAEADARYRANFIRLKDRLRDRLAGYGTVITHNPWGEYGHEEHVQVFRAVEAVHREQGFALWVTGYCSNKSAPLMWRHLVKLGHPTPPIACDPDLGAAMQALYTEAGCWTWFDDYAWPEWEIFFRWDGPTPSAARAGLTRPMNLVWLNREYPTERAPSIARRLRRLTRNAATALGLRS